jgi:hypothetical protein
MRRYTLTILDSGGIQDYVFGTNNLQQNVGASYLVDCATRQWAVEALKGMKHNVTNLDDPDHAFTGEAIEKNDLEAEVIYAGGGNLALLFADHDLAVKFTQLLTSKIILEAPGLRVVVAHNEFDWDQEPLGSRDGILQKTMQALAELKGKAAQSLVQTGLGVTAECVFTGKPAVALDEGRPISREVKTKKENFGKAHQNLINLISLEKFSEPSRDFDQLGQQRNEKSYLAVIHTDGNGMGRRVERIRDSFQNASQNRDYVNAMRAFSLSIQKAAMAALRSTVRLLEANIDYDEKDDIWHIEHQVLLTGKALPFRPIVFGGDDVTFVCDGRLGLSITSYYLQELSKHKLSDKEPLHCRAGIAIVPTHYPFARAYNLAEELCRSAKEFIKEYKVGVTAMDWHVAFGGAILDLDTIRLREYEVPSGNLLMRPLLVGEYPGKDWRSWENYVRVTTEFQSGSEWVGRHNKVKALREALRLGPAAVNNFLKMYEIEKLPALDGLNSSEVTNGWEGQTGHCAYYDSVEMVDLLIPLKEKN